MPALSVLLPTFNESETIRQVLGRVGCAIGETDHEVIVIDDSTDGTDRIVSEIARADPRIRLIHRGERRGLASAVVEGIRAARGEILCVLDADLQHPPERLGGLVRVLDADGADLVVASRYVPGGRYETFSTARRVTSRVATALARLLLPGARRVSDPLSGFFAVRRSAVEGVPLQPLGYKILLEILVRGQLSKIIEMPYRFEARAAGTSKLTVRQNWEYVLHLLRLAGASRGNPARAEGSGIGDGTNPTEEVADRLTEVDGARAAAASEARRGFVRYLREGPIPKILTDHGGGCAPRVSILVPSADGTRSHHLTRLLEQLRDQPFHPIEVIVVQGDRRQGRAINTAAAMARGDLLITMDDDTRLGDPHVIEKLVAAFEADPTIGIAGAANCAPDDAPPVVARAMRELPRRSSPIVRMVTDSDMAEHPCLAIRRDLFIRIGGEHEIIPRGLDPYLRREVRRHGYRVVVIPHTWVHHLLPSTLRKILRQYFRNGVGAAYVQKFYPAFVIEQGEQHEETVGSSTSLGSRGGRYLSRIAGAIGAGRWIYLGTLATYAAGYAWGMLTLREDSL